MKVLAINSSARKNGNTSILIDTVFEELNKEGIETEMIQLAGQVIEPCKACWACGGRENCVHKKDQFQELFEKMKEAERYHSWFSCLLSKCFINYAGNLRKSSSYR